MLGSALAFVIPLVAILAVWFLVRYLIRQRASNAPGWKGALAILQMILVLAAASLLIPPLANTLPSYMRGAFRVLSFCFGFKTEAQGVLLGFILSLVALGLNRTVRVVPTFFLALALLGLSTANLVKIGFPQLGGRAIKGEWGQTYGEFVTPAGVLEQEPGEYLISFDTATLGPHPTGIKIRPGQWFQFDETAPGSSYQYFEDPDKPVTSRRIVTVRGDTLSGGYPLYPRHTKFRGWFHTQDAPAGAVIFRLGGHGNWYPAFPPNQKDSGPQWSNFNGDVWVDINDTVFQNGAMYGGAGSDGLAYHLDNEGVVRISLRVMDNRPYVPVR